MAKRNQASENGQVQDLRPRPVRLTSNMSLPKLSAVEIGSYVLMLFGMWAVIQLRLLGALLAGLLVFQLVHTIAPRIERHMSSGRARWLAVVILSTVIVGALTFFPALAFDLPIVGLLSVDFVYGGGKPAFFYTWFAAANSRSGANPPDPGFAFPELIKGQGQSLPERSRLNFTCKIYEGH